MLKIVGPGYRDCDRLSRRSFVQAGALAFGGVTLAGMLRHKAHAAQRNASVPDTAVIQIFCGGGPSHLDMYDLKPFAPAEVRGEFQEIETNVPGVSISECLPEQARVMDKLAIVRSVAHGSSSHGIASQWVLTGHRVPRETKDNAFPATGAVVSKLRGPNAAGMPAYVAVPRKTSFGNAAYLGSAFNPFVTDGDPNDEAFKVENLQLARELTSARLGDRRALMSRFDRMRRDVDLYGQLAGFDEFSRQAVELVTSERAARAFDIAREDPRLRERYGRSFIGQNCLLARRLVEAGVSYVTCLSGGGWDTHTDNFSVLRKQTLPRYDRAIAALVSDLYERGLDRKVLVMVFGEFGRTPKINKDAGRDHWPGAMSVVLSGGGLRVGQTVGRTDSWGARPIDRPYSPACVLATMYQTMGIDRAHMFYDQSSRPIPVLSDGRPIEELT